MSKDVRSTRYTPLSQAKINDILKNNPSQINNSRLMLHGSQEYDTLNPEATFKTFCSAVKDMLGRYESNKERLVELENEIQDVLHFIELTGNKDVNTGFKLYKRLTDIRRERRACKNEIELLQPVYDMFHDTGFLSRLTEVLGKVRNNKQYIEGRMYSVRTDVLDELLQRK